VIKIRAFKATDDEDSCHRFLEGHIRVLTAFGITMITSAKKDWIYDPGTFVIIAESEDGSKTYGGARIQTPINHPLPIQDAIEKYDSSIHKVINEEQENGGTGELCGLWNSKEVAGLGLGSIFLTRVSVSITDQIGIKTLYALCAPYIVEMATNIGFTVKTSLGNNGTFYYPKDDLLATAMVIEDVNSLANANESERGTILNLRNNRTQIIEETHRNKIVEIEYDLKIKKEKI
jgi:hypothetical protein